MKKLIAITLLLCVALACVPALADTAAPPPAMTITLPYEAPDAETATLVHDEGIFACVYDNTAVYNVITESSGKVVVDYDLDRDGTWDVRLYLTYEMGSFDGYTTLKIEQLENSSLEGKTVTLMGWLTIEFRTLLPAVYTDATGTYDIDGTEMEAEFVKPAKNGLKTFKIPDTVTVNGVVLPVTEIDENALKNQKKLTKITIGKNIKEIGKNAFANCAKLKSVSGGANVEIIGDSAFSGCKALTKFTIGAKVKQIGKQSFYKCAALKKITIKTKLLTAKTVGSATFKGINAQATIKVPKAVKKDYSKWLLKKGVKKTMKIK